MKKYRLNVAVANLRSEPIEALFCGKRDFLQQTQVLFNEKLLGYGDNYGWTFVEAIEQQKCLSDSEWSGYKGWVKSEFLVEVESFKSSNLSVCVKWASIYFEADNGKMEVSIGTTLIGVFEENGSWKVLLPNGSFGYISCQNVRLFCSEISCNWRIEMIELGKSFLYTPYFWGGRSFYRDNDHMPFTGVDCSGLVQLLYRVYGIDLPRDAHDQFLKCIRKGFHEVEIGDLMFLANWKQRSKISHVMMYAGGKIWLEAVIAEGHVRLVTIEEKFGVLLEPFSLGYRVSDHLVFFGGVQCHFRNHRENSVR